MRATFQNSGTSLSIGVFFSLLITGLHSRLPRALATGLQGQGVPHAVAVHAAALPPVSTVFAAFLGFNPVQTLLRTSGVLATLRPATVATLTGKQFFPRLVSDPIHHGLVVVFAAATAMALVAAAVSLTRGGQYFHEERG
jgi:hypothetical protein